MRLPAEWDNELNSLETKIEEVETRLESLRKEMEAELEKVRQSYANRMPYNEMRKLHTQRYQLWIRIREQYPIEHPERKSEFKTIWDAAKVLAHYWQGEQLDIRELVRGIAGVGDKRLNSRAYEFAENLTQPDSPEREYIKAAQHFLWKDVGK